MKFSYANEKELPGAQNKGPLRWKDVSRCFNKFKNTVLCKYLSFRVLFYMTDTSSENHLEEADKDFIFIFYFPYADCKADVLYRRKGLKLNYLSHKCTCVVRINTLEWKNYNICVCFHCFVTDITTDTLSDRRDIVQSGCIHQSDKEL